MARRAVIFDGNDADLRVEMNQGGLTVTIAIVEEGNITGSICMDKRQFEEMESLFRYGENKILLKELPVEVSVNGGPFTNPDDSEPRD